LRDVAALQPNASKREGEAGSPAPPA